MENNNKEERELRELARQLFILATARMRELGHTIGRDGLVL